MWANILKLGGTATQALSPYMMYAKVALVALAVGAIGTHLWNDHQRANDLKAITQEMGTLQQENRQFLFTMLQNERAMTECLDANAWNALQAKQQEVKAATALANVKHLKEMNARNSEDIRREESTLRNRDEECRTADEPLPAWLLPDSLWHD